VLHNRELRGAWIATVGNTTWPSKTGLAPDESKAELTAIFDTLAQANMNAVFLQVRPESDALYASALEPWSRFLTGVQGQDPGWDPLAFAVDEGHRRGLEVHAWLNPYRGLVDAKSQVASTHPTKTLASATRTYGGQLWMDPGAPEVKAHILDVLRDIVTRYDVDGVHFDDYFYPYPVSGQTFDDAATYAGYTSGGGTLGKDDWRRSNVNALVERTAQVVTAARADARFGISPFGIYRPGMPPGITGLDAWAEIYCDPLAWMNHGWVDYIAPQLYWPTTQAAQAFGKLVDWWAGAAASRAYVFVGHDASKAGQPGSPFDLDEYAAEMDLLRAQRDRGVLGSVFFDAGPLVADQANLRTMLASRYWTTPATSPPLLSAAAVPPPAAPAVRRNGNSAEVTVPPRTRSVVLYRGSGSDYQIQRVLPAAAPTTTVELTQGTWAASLVDRRGVESGGAPLEIP
jgi:uncharacterized lipoprotein YddW (UPF0748 family)